MTVEVGLLVPTSVSVCDTLGLLSDGVIERDPESDISSVSVGRLDDNVFEDVVLLVPDAVGVGDVVKLCVTVSVTDMELVDDVSGVCEGTETVLVMDSVFVDPVSRPTRSVVPPSTVRRKTRRPPAKVGLEGDSRRASDVAKPSR